jgi:alpha-glucosidase
VSDRWWRDAVLYQVYVRSFSDANGDGIGDLAGVTERLEYLEWLGIDAVWLNPIHPSPNVDWGYDVSDYTGIHPDLGTLEDLDRLVSEANARGIRVLLDLVPNHTSARHPWFRERRDFYVWADEVPNNWESIFGGGSAWTYDDERGQYYLHNFAVQQPDLNWWSPEVAPEFERILRFWFDRGVAGFRIDVAHAIYKDRELRDDPVIPGLGMRRRYSMFRPETHQILKSWRTLAETYDPPRLLLGEAYSLDVEQWAGYFGEHGDELDLAFAFMLTHADLDAAQMRTVVAEVEAALPDDAWPCWTGSNHDIGRLATRWANGDDARVRCALASRRARFRRIACSTSRCLPATPVVLRCRGRPRADGTTRGCRSRTRAATSRSNAPIASRRCSSRATSSRYAAERPSFAPVATKTFLHPMEPGPGAEGRTSRLP